MNKSMSLLLIEDNAADCNQFKEAMSLRTDVNLIGVTNSSTKGVEMVKTHLPEGVILDVELNEGGEGSGIDFMIDLKKMSIPLKPLIFVVTNSSTNRLYNFLHNQGADLIFYKHQKNYSPDKVLDGFLTMREALYMNGSAEDAPVQTPNDLKEKVYDRIDAELDLIGIPHNLLGRKYIQEALYYLISPDYNESSDTPFNRLAKTHNIASGSISRAMETAINKAWNHTPIDELNKHYTAKIRYDRGTPSATEFVYYYYDKIKKFAAS